MTVEIASVRIAYLSPGADKPAREERRTIWSQDGLAVTEAKGAKEWVVTHVASGYAAIEGFRKQRDAIAGAKLLMPLGDWTLSRTRLPKSMKDGTIAIRADLRERGLIPTVAIRVRGDRP